VPDAADPPPPPQPSLRRVLDLLIAKGLVTAADVAAL
jgi:hypothetical protein